jgi:Bifunctional DNA primase/polymerase, N-terminal
VPNDEAATIQEIEINVRCESSVDLARDYRRRGWQPVPIDRGKKRPRDNAWQSLTITDANIEDYFGNDDNVGVQLGARSGGLTDVDIDCAEALDLADDILPATDAIFGRGSKPRSHRLYITDLYTTEPRATIPFAEPNTLSNGQESAMLVELRTGGGDKAAQTVAPGSVHPSGENVCWDTAGEPSSVSGADLKRSVAMLAVAALLVRHYPAGGTRQGAALVLGGVLARGPLRSADEITKFVTAIARCVAAPAKILTKMRARPN